jgi:predicted Zn-dependent protease
VLQIGLACSEAAIKGWHSAANWVRIFILVLAVSAVPANAEKKPREVGKGVNFYSLEREIALGRQLAQEVERQSKLVDDPIVGEFVNRLGQNLARNSDARVPFSFKIIQDDTLNAFALPGGFIFVNSGLIKASETEAELGSAMAHEVAHVAARHMTRQATRRQIVDIVSIPASILLGGWTGYAVRQGAGVAIPMSFLKFDRAFEGEADLLGIEYLHRTGYDPAAAIDVFERFLSLERKKPGVMARVFATHPMNGDRMREAQKFIEERLAGRAEYVVTTSEFIDIRDRLRRADGIRATPRDADAARPVLRRQDRFE